MALSVVMPRTAELMSSARIEKIFVAEGDAISPGTKLFELRVDLSAVAEQDCPPVTYFMMVSRERGWVRKVQAVVGETYSIGDLLAVASSTADEPIDAAPARSLRSVCAAIVHEPGWLGGEESGAHR